MIVKREDFEEFDNETQRDYVTSLYYCPHCGKRVYRSYWKDLKDTIECPHCGLEIEWEDESWIR